MTQFTRTIVKFSFLTFLLLSPLASKAKPLGIINDLKGNVFVIEKGNVVEGRVGMVVSDLSTIATELGAQVSISDYYDRLFHLSGSGNISFFKNLIELKKGYLWIQSNQSNEKTVLKTANSQLTFTRAEGIISYDNYNDKTQVLTISGYVDLANVEKTFATERVQSGMFSFVQGKYDNGVPRKSTPVGKTSYVKVISLFEDVDPIDKSLIIGGEVITYKKEYFVQPKPGVLFNQEMRGRSLASVTDEPNSENLPLKNMAKGLIEKELSHLRPKKKKSTLPLHKIPVRIYWPKIDVAQVKNAEVKKAEVARAPASIGQKIKVSKDPFKQDLLKEYKKQNKHESELNSLINELDSYKENFNTNY